MRILSSVDFQSFAGAKPAAAVHFDAEWDVAYRPVTRRLVLEAEEVLVDQLDFGEVDVDGNVELAKSLQIVNVPSVAYYRSGKLVAALIGAQQNIRSRLERVLRGEPIGSKDGLDGPSRLCALTPTLSPDSQRLRRCGSQVSDYVT